VNDRPGFLGYDGEDLRGELVRIAQADAAPIAAQRRILSRVTGAAAGAGIGFAAAGTAAATAAVKTSAAITAAGVAKWVAVGLVAGTVTVFAVEKTHPPVAAPPVAQFVEIATPVRSEPTKARAPRVEGAPTEIPAPVVVSVPRRAPSPVPVDEPAQAEPEIAAQQPTVLAQELGQLEEVREAMAQGRAARALDLLRRYDRDFAAGSMSSEAAALRVEALGRAGRSEEAQRAARAFLAKYPRSPLSDRVRVAAGL
jgi:hypothetical protein